jgi:peptidoglycan/xylan/chitin deacetylase (PgdA/CDA1 family)
MKKMIYLTSVVFLTTMCITKPGSFGETEITRWQDCKRGAVSLTYDDGSINQFLKAMPIMDSLEMPGTFFIVTGQIPGSQYHGKFIGRPVKEIIGETASIPTGKDNFFERASAAGYLGLKGTLAYHTKAGAEIDADNPGEAYRIMDELYERVRKGEFPADNNSTGETGRGREITWDEIRSYAAKGHEFASHTVTHPYMAALDEANMLFELEKSREDVLEQLGEKYTFSAECPYGTENERVMEYAHKFYPALRNRMPETFLEELNRSSKAGPGLSEKEYVQWQRGATTKTPMPLMKSWIDTTVVKDNIWLVLVFHGVDGIGWEALSSDSLNKYFRYIRSLEKDLWFATFGDVTRYIRERMNSSVVIATKNRKIYVTLEHSLDKNMYNIPLTLKTYVSSKWNEVQLKQASENKMLHPQTDEKGSFVIYMVNPNSGTVELSGV